MVIKQTQKPGHSLKSLDLLTMKNLDSKVNIILLIAKADTISKNDLQTFKSKKMCELTVASRYISSQQMKKLLLMQTSQLIVSLCCPDWSIVA
ncbi:septin-14-like isoform X2 [Rhinopithecus roxellana]|uniref:septin-14-like n=1 Tax=Rhinopithecus roxellana TaxID=61622 RepID=UPI0012376194|nr:septin-14-like [Rhinopithecus roxellana]XP_030789194.1 septin-14-like isoform X2 [Rhinopithecus roxellana]